LVVNTKAAVTAKNRQALCSGECRCNWYQAMDTAMNASKKINTAPAMGNTYGIIGTTASTASCGCASEWGADMKSLYEMVWTGF
jgi:hypothetical protein